MFRVSNFAMVSISSIVCTFWKQQGVRVNRSDKCLVNIWIYLIDDYTSSSVIEFAFQLR